MSLPDALTDESEDVEDSDESMQAIAAPVASTSKAKVSHAYLPRPLVYTRLI